MVSYDGKCSWRTSNAGSYRIIKERFTRWISGTYFNVSDPRWNSNPTVLGSSEEINFLYVCAQIIAAPKQDRLCLAVAEELEKVFGGWVEPPNVWVATAILHKLLLKVYECIYES